MSPVADPVTDGRRRLWRLGALHLEASAEHPKLSGPLESACSAFSGSTDQMVASVILTVSMDMSGARKHNDRTPDFALSTGSDGALADSSEAWEATLRPVASDGDTPHHYTADVHFRDLSDEPVVWQRAVEGALRVLVATLAPVAGALLLHGAALVPKGDGAGATVFLGASGAGKTTMTQRLPTWSRLSDDTVWVAKESGAWVVRGTPFRGKEGLARNGRAVALERIIFLTPHAENLRLTEVGVGEGYFALLQRLLWFCAEKSRTEDVCGRLAAITSDVPLQRLASSLDHDVTKLLLPQSRSDDGDGHGGQTARMASC
ncbi:MAG: hypothetical protein ACI9MR_004720 [Myxococcota bacterium]